MSQVRQSYIFRPENEFKDGGTGYWYSMPPGAQFSTSHTRATNKITGVGAKTWETQSYGKISGTWSCKFTLDYNHLELLTMFFEAWQNGAVVDTTSNNDRSNTFKIENVADKEKHIFVKRNSTRVPSFCVRRIQLNQTVGGKFDELTIVRGCVAKSCKFSQSSGGSTIEVNMGGSYAVEDIYYVDAKTTDYHPYEDQSLVEFACYLQDGETYMPVVETVGIDAGCTTDVLYSSCGPVAQGYYEGSSSYTLTVSTYTDDYNKLKTRALFSGGAKFSGDYEKIDTGTGLLNQKLTPAARGMKPMAYAVVQTSTNGTVNNDEIGDGASFDADSPAFDIKNATPSATKNIMKFSFKNLIINKADWAMGTSNKLSESATMECNALVIEVMNNNKSVWRPTNAILHDELAIGKTEAGTMGHIILPDATYPYTTAPSETDLPQPLDIYESNKTKEAEVQNK